MRGLVGFIILLFALLGAFYVGLNLGKEAGNLNMKACFIDGLRQGIGTSQIIIQERMSNFSFLQDNTIYISYTEEGLLINNKPASYYNISSRCLR